jgi:hypothetical protein
MVVDSYARLPVATHSPGKKALINATSAQQVAALQCPAAVCLAHLMMGLAG